MRFENTEVWGFEHAFRGLRNPKNSWDRSDSKFNEYFDVERGDVTSEYLLRTCPFAYIHHKDDNGYYADIIGEADMKLAQNLIKAGSEHCKFMRMIHVAVDVDMPRYWWSDADTYHFNKKGIMQTGWQNVNGNWYYLNSKGAMQTGWLLKEGKYYFLNTDGTMAYGWVNSQGSWYYFQKPDGDMLTNAYAPDGRYVNAEGVLIQ